MQKELDEEEPNQEDDWGNPPSPDTLKTARKHRLKLFSEFSVLWEFCYRDFCIG